MSAGSPGSAAETAGRRPTVLVIDDVGQRLPTWLRESFDTLPIPSLTRLDKYLAEVDPDDPPMAALVDVNLNHDPGLIALFKLRSTPATARTVPILFTATALLGGDLVRTFGVGSGDLHAVLCAYACRNGGISVCAKGYDIETLRGTLDEIRRVWARPGVHEADLVGRRHGNLRFIRPVRMAAGGTVPSKNLVHILLGTDAKRAFWEHVVWNQGDAERALEAVMRTVRPKPSATLEGPAARREGPRRADGKAYHLRAFVQGEIGRVARAWDAANRNLLDPAVVDADSVLAFPDDGGRQPSTAVEVFADRYAELLSQPDIADFATWYLRQSWAV